MNTNDLAQRKCVPCRGGTPPLSAEQAKTYLAAVPEWRVSADGKQIARTFTYKDFIQAMKFVNKVAEVAETLYGAGDNAIDLLARHLYLGEAGAKALDYLGAGLPFLTTVPGQPAEVAIASGGAAVSSAAELTDEIIAWSGVGSDARRTRGRQALRYGLDNFGLDANVSRLEGLLAKILGQQPEPMSS